MIEKKYHTGQIELNYGEGAANGLPLVLIHGSGSIWQDWEPVFNVFSEKYHLFAVDLRGFGGSDRAAGSYDITTFTNDMADFIEGVVPEPPVVVGHSLGALITIDLAGRYPDLLRGVVLEDPPVSLLEDLEQWDGWNYFEMALDMIRKSTSVQEATARFVDEAGYSSSEAERTARNLEVIDPGVFEQILRGQTLTLTEDVLKALSRIQCPCLFMASDFELGSLVTPGDLPGVEKSLRNGRITLIKDVGHSIHRESAQAFNQVLATFLSCLHC